MEIQMISSRPKGRMESAPDSEVPLLNAIVSCLTREHQRFEEPLMRLANAATRLHSDPSNSKLYKDAVAAWSALSANLWTHLQLESDVVLSWGAARNDVPTELVEALRSEATRIRDLVKAFDSAGDRLEAAKALSGLAHLLDEHIERQDHQLFPAIQRSLFKHPVRPN